MAHFDSGIDQDSFIVIVRILKINEMSRIQAVLHCSFLSTRTGAFELFYRKNQVRKIKLWFTGKESGLVLSTDVRKFGQRSSISVDDIYMM